MIQKRLNDKMNKYTTNVHKRGNIDSLRSLEDIDANNLVLPPSTISSNGKRNLKSKQSSRNSRNRSSSSTNKQNQKFIVAKTKKTTKAKNLHKLECYKLPIGNEKPTIKDLSNSRSRSRSRKSTKMNSQYKKKLAQAPYPTNMKDNFNLQLRNDLAKQYKHIKSNSEAVTHNGKNLNESGHGDIEQVYSNRKGLRIHNYSPEKANYASQGANEDHNMVIFSSDFNTVKYSQSPFLNKLTGLKQKSQKKDSTKKTLSKGHKSRNSMFPKSYTYQRREPEIYTKLSLRQGSIGQIDEENVPSQDTKSSNPYTNINPYENENNQRTANFIVKDCDQKTIQIGSDKKRVPTVIVPYFIIFRTQLDQEQELMLLVSQLEVYHITR
jgi:hypothetical protein